MTQTGLKASVVSVTRDEIYSQEETSLCGTMFYDRGSEGRGSERRVSLEDGKTSRTLHKKKQKKKN